MMRTREFLFGGSALFLTFPRAFWKVYSQPQQGSLEPHQLGMVTLIKDAHGQSSVLQMSKVDRKAIIA